METNLSLPNLNEVFSALWNTLPNDFVFLISLAKAAGIVLLIYLVILVVGALIKIRSSLRMKNIEKNVSEINEKLSLLLKKSRKS